MLKDSCFCEDDNNGGGYVSPLWVDNGPPMKKSERPLFRLPRVTSDELRVAPGEVRPPRTPYNRHKSAVRA